MVQYQTFPGLTGDSYTLEKLKCLRLPSLTGKHFLDVGCNEGFFCGYASFDCAARSVGLDYTPTFIERARERFPDCEFFQQSWDDLPPGPYDVILLASALHYADDQEALISKLISQLAPGGTLVLELGIVSGNENEWKNIKRGIDNRKFPTWAKLENILRDYAWKHVGPSVSQQGDPVRRHVIHIGQRRPVVYLLMQPPGYGKSSIARSLFLPAGLKVVSGDTSMHQVVLGTLTTSKQLKKVIKKDFSPLRIDQAVKRAFEAGLSPDLVDLWVSQSGVTDFALDAYVPKDQQNNVEQLFSARGFMPVTLQWERIGKSLPAEALSHSLAANYYGKLAEKSGANTTQSSNPNLSFKGTVGYVDEITLAGGLLTVRGWALHESGYLPRFLGIDVAGDRHMAEDFEKQLRPDVQKHYALDHAICGYMITLPVDKACLLKDVANSIEVFGGSYADTLCGPFHLADKVLKHQTVARVQGDSLT